MPIDPPLNNEKIEEAIALIMQECSRIGALLSTNPLPSNLIDEFPLFSAKLRLKSRREIELGGIGTIHLRDLSDAILGESTSIFGRIDKHSFFKIVLSELEKLVEFPASVTGDIFRKRCVKAAIEETKGVLTYFIPCVAPNHSLISKFKIGRVNFWRKGLFLRTRLAESWLIEKLKKDKFEAEYADFNYVAEVSINDFSEVLASERAKQLVRIAIAAIKVLMPLHHSVWLGSQHQATQKRRQLSFRSESRTPQQTVLLTYVQFTQNGDDSDVGGLLTKRGRHWFYLVGELIDQVADKVNWSFLENKLSGALIWADIGNSPCSNAEKIIAFSNCLESISVTRKEEIASQIAERVGKMLSHTGWRPELHDQLKSFYTIRSKLAHGEGSPNNASLEEAVSLGKYFTDASLYFFIAFAKWMLSRHLRMKTKKQSLPYQSWSGFQKSFEVDFEDYLAILEKPKEA